MQTVDSCTHCGLPVAPALRQPEGGPQFCCAGCRAVHALIHSEGLERFYDVRGEEVPGVAALPSGRSYAEYDDPSFRELYCRSVGDGLLRTELTLEGLHCAACVWLIERLARRSRGRCDLRVDYGRSRVLVTWSPEELTLSRIARRLDGVGYASHPYRRSEAEALARREDRDLLIRLGICGAVAGNVMLIAFALYGGMFHGMSDELARFFRWTTLFISVPAVVVGGGVFFRGAFSALRERVPHMDLPIAVGILAGAISGTYHTVLGTGEIYFDSVTALIFLLLVGRYLQRRQQRRASDATALLFSLTPRVAHLLEGAVVRDVPVEALRPGARIRVLPGEMVPADGEIVLGSSAVDRALLTGESRPVSVGTGDPVEAGVTNLSGPVELEVRRAGAETRVGQLMQQVEEESRRRAHVVRTADRLAGVFVVVVLLLAAITALVWLQLDPGRAVDSAIALLVITCPCALGLATPLAVSAAIGQAARRGILIKGGDVLEALSRGGLLWLDKTGTLTEGRAAVVEWRGDETVRGLVAALEAHSRHPVAAAFAGDAPAGGVVVEDVVETRGAGIRGSVADRNVVIGTAGYLQSEGVSLPVNHERTIAELTDRGLTPVTVAMDGAVVAVAGIADRLRDGAVGVLERLRRQGWRIGMLSGDHPEVVEGVGETLGVPAGQRRGAVTPEEKARVVRDRDAAQSAEETVAMVGDGVNDATALAGATVGIAVHGGAEVALSAADVHLSRAGLEPLVELMDGSRRTLWVIRRNLLFSLVYNVVGVTLAVAGLVTPLVAAILMPLSSLTVIASSYRARTFADPAPPAARVSGAAASAIALFEAEPCR